MQSTVVDLTRNNVYFIRISIYNSRRKTLPPLPRNIMKAHTALNSLEINIYKRENLLLVNDINLNIENKFRICMILLKKYLLTEHILNFALHFLPTTYATWVE